MGNRDYDLDNVKSGKGHLEKIFAIADQNRVLTLTLLVLTVLVLWLGMGLIQVKKNMIMSINIPERIYVSGKAQIARDKANEVFYNMWGAYIVNEIMGNYDHKNVKEKFQYLLDNISPHATGKYLSSIKSKVKNTTSQLITHRYDEGKDMFKGDEYGMTYISYGRGVKKIGEIEEFEETCEYQVEMSVKNYALQIDRVYESCTREEKK